MVHAPPELAASDILCSGREVHPGERMIVAGGVAEEVGV